MSDLSYFISWHESSLHSIHIFISSRFNFCPSPSANLFDSYYLHAHFHKLSYSELNTLCNHTSIASYTTFNVPISSLKLPAPALSTTTTLIHFSSFHCLRSNIYSFLYRANVFTGFMMHVRWCLKREYKGQLVQPKNPQGMGAKTLGKKKPSGGGSSDEEREEEDD